MSIKNISVFCGAHLGNNPIYASEAKKIAEVIVEKGMNVVFGGGDVGLMGVVSHTAIDNGGEVLGISLQSLYELELTNPRIQEVVVAKTLLERKDIFMQRSDAFIVLPGGVGSLDELAEVMCSNQLGIINKPIGILNTNGYYDHLLAWMKKAVEEGFVSDANFNELIISDSCADLIERVASEKRPADDDWTNRLGL
ncbi:TIGR00730 family Rossman fold protein [Gammaproteobacteria bacterium]|nr:TIGR00730 family Rossman fold protein [Gammaproteobacteria bacterium]